MRNDGRRGDELRPMKLEPGYTRYAGGSVPVTQGQTVVLCNATVQDLLPSWMSRGVGGEEVERGGVTAEAEPFDRAMLRRQLDPASGGIGELLRAQLAALEQCAAR
jgi:ribonuclease PH